MMKLYVSDLDGTLLRNNASLSEFTRENLNLLIDNGMHFTVASARSIVAIQRILGQVNFRLPVIEFNGSFITDYHTGEHQVINSIDPSLVIELFLLLDRHHLGYTVSSFDGQQDRLYYSEILNEGLDWYYQDRIRAGDKRLTYRRNLRSIINEEIVSFTIIDRQEALQDVYHELHQRYANEIEIYLYENYYTKDWYWLTLHQKKATKDQAIKQIMDQYGFKPEELTVFGDEMNDYPMFKLAAHAVAVGNAVEGLKEAATSVIGTNEEDSVVKYLMGEK
ncbi:HAD family phosphatase [Paenibacillus albiflavus]|uniref:HAD family phosphatase n=1 Tax=Paenibacillus albiflavus TaxID=2545760 RepID=A0A4R4EJC6_9BACL|nr:HAD family hydrolase [Paenibacillus albiflavus]TCZ80059.1 HAD family phosphatase [Paenibacillus albiflavus]